MDAEALNTYNKNGFTFGFNAPTELVSNPFAQPIYAVDYTERLLLRLKVRLSAIRTLLLVVRRRL